MYSQEDENQEWKCYYPPSPLYFCMNLFQANRQWYMLSVRGSVMKPKGLICPAVWAIISIFFCMNIFQLLFLTTKESVWKQNDFCPPLFTKVITLASFLVIEFFNIKLAQAMSNFYVYSSIYKWRSQDLSVWALGVQYFT